MYFQLNMTFELELYYSLGLIHFKHVVAPSYLIVLFKMKSRALLFQQPYMTSLHATSVKTDMCQVECTVDLTSSRAMINPCSLSRHNNTLIQSYRWGWRGALPWCRWQLWGALWFCLALLWLGPLTRPHYLHSLFGHKNKTKVRTHIYYLCPAA